MDRLLGRRAVVTGGARGIGAAMARAFVDEGAEVVILDLDGERAAATAAGIGPACQARTVDVRSESDVDAAFDGLESTGLAVDLLVNDAAIQREAALADQTVDDFHVVVDTNLLGTFLCSRAALRGMRRRRAGVIINMSSVLGLTGDSLLPIYSATKHAILGLDEVDRGRICRGRHPMCRHLPGRRRYRAQPAVLRIATRPGRVPSARRA